MKEGTLKPSRLTACRCSQSIHCLRRVLYWAQGRIQHARSVRCSVLQCVAVRRSMLQCICWCCAMRCCSVLQCVAVCCIPTQPLLVPSLSTPHHTRCPPPPPLAKESSSVGRATSSCIGNAQGGALLAALLDSIFKQSSLCCL